MSQSVEKDTHEVVIEDSYVRSGEVTPDVPPGAEPVEAVEATPAEPEATEKTKDDEEQPAEQEPASTEEAANASTDPAEVAGEEAATNDDVASADAKAAESDAVGEGETEAQAAEPDSAVDAEKPTEEQAAEPTEEPQQSERASESPAPTNPRRMSAPQTTRSRESTTEASSESQPAVKVPPGRMYEWTKVAREARESWVEEQRSANQKREEEEFTKNCTFRPSLGRSSPSRRESRDVTKYFQESDAWIKRRENHLEKLRKKADTEALDLDNRVPMSKTSAGLVKKMEADAKYTSIVSNWKARMSELNESKLENEKKHTPSFSPKVNELPEFYKSPDAPGADSSPSGAVRRKSMEVREQLQAEFSGPDRMYKIAAKEREEKQRKLAQVRRTKSPNAVKHPVRDESGVQDHVKAMMKRAEESQRKLKAKRLRAEKDEKLFDATFKPEITKRSADMKRSLTDLTQAKPKPEAAKVEEAPKRKAAPLSDAFFMRNDKTLHERDSMVRQAIQEREEAEMKECSFAPQISSQSAQLVETSAHRRRFYDPTAATEAHIRQGDEPDGVSAQVNRFQTGLGANKRNGQSFVYTDKNASPSNRPPAKSSRAAARPSAPIRAPEEEVVEEEQPEVAAVDETTDESPTAVDEKLKGIEAQLEQWRAMAMGSP